MGKGTFTVPVDAQYFDMSYDAMPIKTFRFRVQYDPAFILSLQLLFAVLAGARHVLSDLPYGPQHTKPKPSGLRCEVGTQPGEHGGKPAGQQETA